MYTSPSVLLRARPTMWLLQFLANAEITTSHFRHSPTANLPPTNPYVQNLKQRWSKGTAVSGSIKIDLPIQASIWHLWQKRRDKNLFLWHLPKATELTLLYPLGSTGLIHDTSHTLSPGNYVLIQKMWCSGALPISRTCMHIFRMH